MDCIGRRRVRLERRLLHAERSWRRKASRAWILRERLARMPFGDLGAVASLAGGLEADAESAAAWKRRAVRYGKELAGLDAERAANADVDGSCRFLAGTDRCGRPTTDGSRWCAAHADLWAKDGAHAAGLWRFPEVLYGDVVDFRPPMPVSADEMRQWAKSTADLLRLGFGAMDEKEARRWSTPPSL